MVWISTPLLNCGRLMGCVVCVFLLCVCEENAPSKLVSEHQKALGQEKQLILTLCIL